MSGRIFSFKQDGSMDIMTNNAFNQAAGGFVQSGISQEAGVAPPAPSSGISFGA